MKLLWWQDTRIQSFLNKYRAMSQRERRLTLLTSHIVFAAILLFFIVIPLWSNAVSERVQANELEINALRYAAHLQRLRASPLQDPNEAVRVDIEKVIGQQAAIDGRIQKLTDALVAPESMPSVLESMMTQDANLKLVSLKNTDAEGIVLGTEFNDVDLFRHGMKIRMKTDYPSLVRYLQRLDTLPWKVYWQSLHYTVENYPVGELHLEVFTLSTREEIISD